MQIVDKFNEIGNNFAISSTGIGEALQRSASALAAAGNSIDESVALITAANSVVQNPEQVGTALKTLSMRLRGTKTELEEAGEDTDGMANSVSQLQQKLLALSHNKVDIMADADTYKNSTEILREMADAWQYMTDVEKAAALELMGGKRQGNILASIIENFDIVEDVIEKSMDAEGSALKENEKYLDSIDGKTKQFTNSLQTMWMNAIDTNAVKGFIDFGTTLIRIFDQINKNNPIGIFGGLAVVGGTLYGAYKGLPKLFSSGISSLAKYVAGINGVKLATDGLTKSQYATQLATTILSDEQKEAALAALFGANADNTATIATDLKTKAEIRAALAATGLQGKELELAVSSVMAATGTNTLSASLGLLIKNIGAVTLAILKSPIFWIAAAIVAVIAVVDALTVSFKEAKEQLKKTSEELESVQSEIESLNNELETTSKRIDELNSKDTLTIVEQDELDALNAQNAALEAQKELLEQREEILKNQQARDALTTFEKDQSFKSGSYNETDEQGYATGNVIEIDPEVDQLIARRKRNAEGLAEANEQLKIAQEELLKAQKEGTDTKSQQRAVDNAIKEAERYKKALETSENDLINLIKEREETYGDVGFFYGDPDDLTETQKQWNETLTQIKADAHKAYIELDNTGKAASSAFKEISSRQFFSDELQQIQEQVGITGEELKKILDSYSREEAQKLLSLDESGLQEYIDLYDYYIGEVDKAKEKNIDLTKTVYGNIDLNNRQVLEWTKENIIQYKDAIESWGMSMEDFGDISTVLGTSSEYEGIEIAFSPILQTENGPKLLDANTVDKYIYGLIDKAIEQGKPINAETLFELDTTGLEFNGQQIKKLLAGVGDEARKIGESMHYLGTDGSISGSFKAIEDAAKEAGVSTEDFIGIISNVGESGEGMNQFIQTLIDSGVIANNTAEELQKVVDLSIALSKGSTEAERANKRLARSQKMLDYYNLAKDLHKYTNNVKSLTDAQKDEISIIKNKMSALAVEINAYDILGDKLAEVKQSFEDFENAQTADSNSDFTDDVSSMLQTIIEGYQSAEMGSEAFKSAFTSLIPESVYKDIDTLQGKYEAVAEYIRGTLSNYFKIEYDDDGLVNSIEVTTKNVQNFIEDARDKRLMNFADGVWTVNETDFEQFAKKMGITEEMLVAIGEQMDKIDADWITGDLTSFFDSFKMDAESEIYKNVRALAALDEQLIDGKINAEEYATKYKEYTDAIKESTNEAIDNINGYNEATKTVDALSEELSAAKDKLKELQDSGASESEIKLASENVERVVKELDTALKLKDELGIPSQIELTFAQDSISAQYEALKAKWTNTTIELPVDLNVDPATNQLVKFDEEAGKYVISTELEGLSDEELGILQEYADLVNTQGTINLYMANYEQEAQKVEDLKTTAQETQDILENLDVKVEAKEAISTLNIIKSTLDSIKDKTVTITTINQTVETSVSKPAASKNNRIGGNTMQAYAGGTNRVESNERNALVGELGKELVVDPNTGSYYTVGDRGAEFIDLPKNAIVFNHKQTEEILKNGHINSRGKAYVNGKAFGGTSGTMYTGGAIESAFGGVVPGWFPKNSTLQNLGSSIDGASSSAEDDFEELFDWFEILTEEIEAQIDLMEAQLENSVGIDSKKSIYSGIISTEYAKMDAFTKGIALYTEQANKFLAQIPAQYKEMAKDGAIKITEFTGEANEKVVEAIKNYREWANKATDLNQQLEETKKRISDLRVETQNMISTEYDNKIGLITNLNDTLEAQIGLLEEKGERSSAKFYEEMAKNGDTQLKQLQQKRDAMQAELDSAVKSGDVTKYSDDWYEMVNAIYEVDKAVIDCETSIEGFNNSIQELHWENFEKIIDSITAVSDEAEQLRDLIDDTDITEASDPEKWSKDGVTALGLVAQQMENAQYRSKLYAKEIEYLKDEYKKGNYSQDEYNEKLRELKKNQWDAIDAYESAKDAIVDLNKTRVEAIKSGIQKEIDAYEKLINKRKEDLSAQQDAHEWANTVKDHTKNIDTIQLQIDAMEGDTSAAAAAQRKKLQEELAAAQEEYDEALYNRSIETQQQSLDKSLEVYRQEQEAKMEELDAWLEKEEQVIAESYDVISANTEAIHSNIEAISDKYGIEIENNVVEPWTAGITALGTYETELDTATSRYVEMLGRVRQELVDIQLAADNTAASIINATNEASKKTESAVKDPPKPAPKPSKPSKPSYSGGYSGGYSSDFSNGQQVIVNSDATNFSRDGGNGGTKMHSWVPGSSFTVMETRGDEVLIGIPGQGYTGWVKKEDLTIKYAKGTTGVKNNQLAWIDENGLEEIVMHADNGRLTYLTKGSSVIPHDISENLMELGKVDPRTWMENNRKTTVPMNLTTNNNTIDLRFGSLINIEHADRDSIPEIQAAVQKQLDSYMKNINAGIKKYSR